MCEEEGWRVEGLEDSEVMDDDRPRACERPSAARYDVRLLAIMMPMVGGEPQERVGGVVCRGNKVLSLGVDFTSFVQLPTKSNQNTVAAVSCLLYFILLLLSSHRYRQQPGDARPG